MPRCYGNIPRCYGNILLHSNPNQLGGGRGWMLPSHVFSAAVKRPLKAAELKLWDFLHLGFLHF